MVMVHYLPQNPLTFFPTSYQNRMTEKYIKIYPTFCCHSAYGTINDVIASYNQDPFYDNINLTYHSSQSVKQILSVSQVLFLSQ